MSVSYPINVTCTDGDWGCDGHAPSEERAIREALRLSRESDSEPDDLDPKLWTAHLADRDLLDGELSTQTLSRDRIEEAYSDEIDNLGARLVKGASRWHLFVEYWEVELKGGEQ